MKIRETRIPDVKLIEPKVFGDERGFFMETWNEKAFREREEVMLTKRMEGKEYDEDDRTRVFHEREDPRDKEMEQYKMGQPAFSLDYDPTLGEEGAFANRFPWEEIPRYKGDEGIKRKWQDIYNAGGWDLMDKIGIAGGVANMAEGGIASLKKK